MVSHRSIVCAGALALLMTAPALAWEGEGRDHGPGYQTYLRSAGGDQGGGGWNRGSNGGSGGKGYDWGGGAGGGGTGGRGGPGLSHSAPSPELGAGLPVLLIGGYLWYRRRAKQRRTLSAESKG